MPDLLIAAALFALLGIGIALVMTVPPGAAPRYMQARRYHRSGSARHARTGVEIPMSALETMPDPIPFVRAA